MTAGPWAVRASALAALLLAAPAALANLEQDGELSFAYRNNVSNALIDRDIFADRLLAGNYNLSKLWVPAAGRSIVLAGHLGFEKFDRSTGLDRLSHGASLAWIQRLGLGAYAPRAGLSLRADRHNYQVNMRDGWVYRARAHLEQRFTPDLQASLSLSRERRTADADKVLPYYALAGADVFNQDNYQVDALAHYTLRNNSLLSAGYTYRDGESDASTRPASAYFLYADAIAQDYELCDGCETYVAYRVKTSVHSLLLDWNWPLGRDSSVSVNFQRRVAHANGDITYSGNILKVQLNMRF